MNAPHPSLSPLKPRLLKCLIPACGGLGLLLRLLLTATGIDDKGLLMADHPAWIALLILTAAVTVVVLLGTAALRGSSGYRSSFPRSAFAAAAGVLAAASAVISAVRHFSTGPALPGGSGILAGALFSLSGAAMVLAAVSFILAGLCRLTERKPLFLFHVVICVWFAMEMLTLYQTWSFAPQLQDYCFQLFACIALTMTAYQLASFDIDKGCHRKLWFWGLSAVYLCCLCLNSGLFFIAGGLWAFANLSDPKRPRQRKPAEAEITAAE